MKSILTCLLSLTVIFVTTDSMADMSFYFAGDNEPLYGTWINMDYQGEPPQLQIYNSDGTGEFSKSVYLDPFWKIKYLISGKGTDKEGNIMYKIHLIGNWKFEVFSLYKISDSGNALEFVYDYDKYPKEIDPQNPYYRKYTRK